MAARWRAERGRLPHTFDRQQLILDHLLLGLRPMTHDDGTTGYGRLFKWEKCSQNTANQLVVKCSTFLVWLGGGSTYPGDLHGLPIRVVTDGGYWDAKVAAWKSRHGM